MNTWNKLQDGRWGVRCALVDAKLGARITVTKRDGTMSVVMVERVERTIDDVAICAVKALDAGGTRRAPQRRRGRSCSCNQACCRNGCRCDAHCVCRGGNICDC